MRSIMVLLHCSKKLFMKPFPSSIDRSSFELLDVIDFKWLMGREGHRVHVERLQGDPIYARSCFNAAKSGSEPALRAVASRLLRALDGATPAA